MMITKIKVQTVFIYACNTYTESNTEKDHFVPPKWNQSLIFLV